MATVELDRNSLDFSIFHLKIKTFYTKRGLNSSTYFSQYTLVFTSLISCRTSSSNRKPFFIVAFSSIPSLASKTTLTYIRICFCICMCSLNLIILILIAYKLNILLFDCKHFTNYDTFKVHRRAERLHCRFRPIHSDCDLIFLNVFHRFGFQLPSTSYVIVIVNVIAAMTITEAKFVTGIWAGSVTRSFCHRLCRCLYQSRNSVPNGAQ